MSILDYSVLERAVAQLEKSFDYLHSSLSREKPDLREQFRGATIQAFEYTYELAVKMIRRQLEQIAASPEHLREMAFMDFMRTAAEAGLVRDPLPFKTYREKRNLTAHTYNADWAEEVVSVVRDFLRDIRFLLSELARRNGGETAKPIDINPQEMETVRRILHASVPEWEVRAFGSRVSWTARKTSDLDLVIMTDKPLSDERRTDLKEAFSESDLPFKVDVLDWASTDGPFRQIIGKRYIVVQEGRAANPPSFS